VRDYGRVHSTFWSSPNIRALSDDGRALALYLLTSPHTTLTGTFRLPDGYVSEDMQWSAQRVTKGFAELLANGFANRCETTKWAWITKFLEWNAPENPNQWKAARKIAAQVPDECSWKRAFLRAFAISVGDPVPEELNPSETVTEPFLNQEQEQEQEEDIRPSDVGADAPAAPKRQINGSLQTAIIAAYHELLPDLPSVKTWPDRRKRKLEACIGERVKQGKPADTVEYWQALFRKVAASDFLCGRKTDWRCDGLEWLLEPKHFAKLIEGGYDNNTHGGTNGRGNPFARTAALG
jgi:hypothetical protein